MRLYQTLICIGLIILPAGVCLGQIAPPPERTEEEEPAAPQILSPPELEKFVNAPYPPLALEKGIEAKVPVQIDIGADGSVSNPVVVTPAGWGFDEAAVEAIKQFVFKPAMTDKGPLAVRTIFTYSFTIEEKEVEVEAPPAEPVLRLKGRLLERGTKKPLGGIGIEIPNTDAMTVSREDGTFELYDLPAGMVSLLVPPSQYLEYRKPINIPETGYAEVTLRLRKDPFSDFRTVVKSAPENQTKRTLTTSELQKIPGTAGDALKAIQNLPSVARAPGGSAQLIVRGSNPEDTIYRLDDLFLPQLYHFGGVRSIINTDMIESIDFYPGGFSVKHGNATAGLVDVKLKPGRLDRWGGYVDINVFDTTAYASGPVNDKGSLTFSLRRSYIDVLLETFAPDIGFVTAPVYYDYQAQYDQEVTDNDRIRVLAYGTDDQLNLLFDNPDESDPGITGGIRTHSYAHGLQTRWEREITDDLTLTSSLLGARQVIAFDLGPEIDFNLDLWRLGWREDFRWFVSEQFEMEWGMDVDYVMGGVDITAPLPPKEGSGTTNGKLAGLDVLSSKSSNVFGQRAFYLENTAKPWMPLAITTGARLDWFGGEYKAVTVDPRGSIRYTIIPETVLKGGVGLYHRRPDFDELDTVFGTPDLEPEAAIQYYAGIEQEIVEGLTIDLQGFYKTQFNMVSTLPDTVPELDEAGNVIEVARYDNDGEGRVYGGELMLRQQFGRWFWGWIAYTLSRSERKPRPEDDFRIFDYDQTHILTLVASSRLPWELELGARLRYVSGNPITPVTGGVFDADAGVYLPINGVTNSQRDQDFFQLDIRLDRAWTFEDWILQGYIEVQNATNQANGNGYEYNFDYSERSPSMGLPIIPGFGLKAIF